MRSLSNNLLIKIINKMNKFIKGIATKIKKIVEYKTVCSTYHKAINEMRTGGVHKALSSNQIKETQDYFQKFWGEKISLKWHEYFYYLNDEFSPRYMPTYIYYGKIIPKLNNRRMGVVYSDKNMAEKLLGNRIRQPKTYIKNINGIFYIDEKVVSKQTAIEACKNINDAVIKHSIDSLQGKSVCRFSSKNGLVSGKNCPDTIEKLLDMYNTNYLIQAAIQQHPEMAKLNPTSLNTIRVMTYWSKNGVVVLYAVVRMGRTGSVIDNASAGGLYCGVKNDGRLKEHAYTLTPFSRYEKSDTGIIFKDFRIPMYQELKEKAIELHQQLPYSKFIGWDLSINNNNEIELVEINANGPGLFQGATGPAFGDYTEEILEYCRE